MGGVNDDILTRWGANIRSARGGDGRARRNGGLSQPQLAALVGVNASTISRWEAGLMEPDRTHKAALALALGVSVADLFPLDAEAVVA